MLLVIRANVRLKIVCTNKKQQHVIVKSIDSLFRLDSENNRIRRNSFEWKRLTTHLCAFYTGRIRALLTERYRKLIKRVIDPTDICYTGRVQSSYEKTRH